MSQPQYRLIDYNFRGLAEPIRMIFAYAGAQFDDVRIAMNAENYPRLSESVRSRLPFGKVPVLELGDGRVLSQSMAIAHFLSKEFKLDGKDEFEAAQCVEIVGSLRDFQRERHLISNVKCPELKGTLETEFRETTVPFYMSRFEKIVTQNGGKHYVGDGVTWADLSMACFVEMITEKYPEGLSAYPGVKSAGEGILDLPQIRKWIDSRPASDTIPTSNC